MSSFETLAKRLGGLAAAEEGRERISTTGMPFLQKS